jgi:hypothetical protein
MPVDELRRYRHADPAFEIDLPAGLEAGPAPGALIVVADPAGSSASPFRASLTVVAQELPGGVDATTYVDECLAEAVRHFPGWRLIDRAETLIGDLPAERTLATYLATPETGVDLAWTVSVTLEQWVILQGGLAWVISCSCDTGDYAQVYDRFERCVDSLRLGEATR